MTHIFVNIPTSDLERSKAFYTSLGADINPLFTDENAACIVWDENVFFMVLTKEYFAHLHRQAGRRHQDPRAGAHRPQPRLARGRRQGRSRPASPTAAASRARAQDYGFMYTRDLEDPDGNILEFLYMDPAAAEQGPEVYMAEQGQA